MLEITNSHIQQPWRVSSGSRFNNHPKNRSSHWNRWIVCGCFLKWWYPQNTPKLSFLVGKPLVFGYQHFRKPPMYWQKKQWNKESLLINQGESPVLHPFWRTFSGNISPKNLETNPTKSKQIQLENNCFQANPRKNKSLMGHGVIRSSDRFSWPKEFSRCRTLAWKDKNFWCRISGGAFFWARVNFTFFGGLLTWMSCWVLRINGLFHPYVT